MTQTIYGLKKQLTTLLCYKQLLCTLTNEECRETECGQQGQGRLEKISMGDLWEIRVSKHSELN